MTVPLFIAIAVGIGLLNLAAWLWATMPDKPKGTKPDEPKPGPRGRA